MALSLAVAKHWGFEQFQHEIPSALDLGRTTTPPPCLAGVTLTVRTEFAAAARDAELAAAYAECDDSPEAQTGQISGWTSFLGLAGDVAGRAMKLRLHQELAQRGVRRVVTANEADNQPIRTLNAALGYVPASGGIRLRRDVDDAWFS